MSLDRNGLPEVGLAHLRRPIPVNDTPGAVAWLLTPHRAFFACGSKEVTIFFV
jgi:hypothetical protein